MYCNTNFMETNGLYFNKHSSEHAGIWITEVRTANVHHQPVGREDLKNPLPDSEAEKPCAILL